MKIAFYDNLIIFSTVADLMSLVTKLVILLFIAYLAKSLHVFYDIFHYSQCDKKQEKEFRFCIDVSKDYLSFNVYTQHKYSHSSILIIKTRIGLPCSYVFT